jgi:RNA polymerase-binding transcription factor DksA
MSASIAMSRLDTTTLDPSVVIELHQVLLAEREAQRVQLGELHATVEDLTGHVDGDSVFEREIAERSIVRALEVMALVEHAIEKLTAGTYGACERCGKSIAPARLEAIPYAQHCVSCQSAS